MRSFIGAIFCVGNVVCEEVEDGGRGFILLNFEMKWLYFYYFILKCCFTCLLFMYIKFLII